MKNSIKISLLLLICVIGFFYKDTFLSAKIPVPSDALVGLYHPWRDLFSGQYPNGIPYKNFLITDPIRQQIPWRKEAMEHITKGKIPLWNSNDFSGTPFLSNIQSGALYPLNLIFFLVSFPIAWSILIIFQSFAGGILMFLYLYNRKLSPASACLGAIAWIFSGFFIAWLTWGTIAQAALWFPLILLSIDGWREEKQFPYLVLLGVSLAMSFFAGHAQIFFYGVILTCCYACYRFIFLSKDTAFERGIWFPSGIAVTFLFVLIATSIVWWPFYHVLSESSRFMDPSLLTKEGWFIPYQHLIQFLIPDFFGNPATLNYWGTWNYGELVGYIGIIPLLFALRAIVRPNKHTMFWIVVLVVSFLFALPTPLSQLPYMFQIPLISSMQPTRLLVLICFALSVLAAYGFHQVIEEKRSIVVPWIFMAVCFSVILIIEYQFFSIIPVEYLSVVKRNTIIPVAVFAGATILYLISRVKKEWIIVTVVGLLLLTSIDSLRFGKKFTPFTPLTLFFPQTKTTQFLLEQQRPLRVMAIDDRAFPANVAGYYNIESVSGYDPVSLYRYEAFIAAMERGKPDIAFPFGFNRIVSPKRYDSPLYPHLAASYIVSLSPLENLPMVFQEGETRVYKDQRALPRVYIVNTVRQAASDQEAINLLYDPLFQVGKEAVIEKPLPEPLMNHAAEIHGYEENNGRIRINYTADGPVFFVLSVPFDSWWRATINYKETEIYRTNFAFQGVLAPMGTHVIEFTYGIHN